ncbi:MAG TPA: penicillin-binding transpeptidase domain-containing protein [Mobilitalea sp.]|nr:penicillin-binding transpeptidase domain-containing protein [Mobilitalea sp.]
MFDVFMDYVKKIFKSRLFPITVVYIVLFAIIINQLFVIQIVKGPTIEAESGLLDTKERTIDSTRGNIYDCNGVLLASNKLSYSVVMEDITTSNDNYNAIINQLIKIIEKNGDTLDTDFGITINDKGDFEFTVSESALTRFKKAAYTYALENKELTQEQTDATAKDVFEFLRYGTDIYPMFNISDKYSDEEALKIMSIRFALLCNYPKYLQVTIASNVSEATVAAVMENSADLQGVDIKQQQSRFYYESQYFAHIIGYTGKISADELAANGDKYTSSDVIGKTGLEKQSEAELAGTKGKEILTTDSNGKVVNVEETIAPKAGNDIYLTIDSKLQKSAYDLLEREITQILLDSIVPDMNYGSKGVSATNITIPIYEVYNALINNNIIDVNAFNDSNATDLEKATRDKYITALNDVYSKLDEYLNKDSTITNDKTGDMENFLDYFYQELTTQKILVKSKIPANDATYNSYVNNKISLSKFLQYALANNWIDLSILKVGDEYHSTDELYQQLISSTKELLKNDDTFNKLIYRNLVFSYKLTGTEICLLLFDQGVLKYNADDIKSLKNGSISAYSFIRSKLEALEITPGMLALEPCSGSVVITDVNTGEVLALVTYPSYDNNRLANKIDSNYYSKLLKDNSFPLINYALKNRIAPGSTFKMVTSVAALEEGVTTPAEHIYDEGIFDKITPAAKCHIYPGTHGSVDLSDALKVSCNYFFYWMGYKLSLDSNNNYNSELGLSKLAKYATLFGLNEKSGIELDESQPAISTEDAVRSAIGQGNNDFTPAVLARYITTIANRGTCYNLTVLDKEVDKSGNIVKNYSATVNHKLNISDSTWNTVYQGMYSVVNSNGGSVQPIFNGFGVTVAGKTGTSQVSKSNPNNALFLSFAPYNKPQISVTTVIPRGYTSHNAARLSKNIYSYYFGLADEQTLLDSYNKSTSNGGTALE